METLKERFIDELQDGAILTIAFTMFDSYSTKDNEIIRANYMKVKNVLYRIFGSQDVPSFIDVQDMEDNLRIYNPEYKEAIVVKVIKPSTYHNVYKNDLKPRLTKKEIERLLGYEIIIVEE